MKISVVINTYNAEKHLRTVLDTVKDFDEVVICDMHSTDSTIAIAEQYDCKIVLGSDRRTTHKGKSCYKVRHIFLK